MATRLTPIEAEELGERSDQDMYDGATTIQHLLDDPIHCLVISTPKMIQSQRDTLKITIENIQRMEETQYNNQIKDEGGEDE